ncbi:MAG TPA: hypothetical protein PLH92_12405 [Mycobacterium sp.]|uniref:hypothetical protein n=1 Tax=Mycolicibacterium sp. TaxID=2320850 RepID=UPI0025D81EA8|nr:hypothetical protein [Mycolicibacterium sp.]HPX37086.1 hypothetical protein [Mycobacterium sp.]HQC77511.1 hypothetical protein [Mycobacterium sp.]
MTRIKNRVFAATAGLAACGVILTGCGTGQISQSAGQESAVNGNSANVKNIALRNVYLQAAQSGDFLQPGRIVPLLFVAANNSQESADKLVSITSDAGTVALSGDGAVPIGGALVANAGGAPGETAGTVTPPTAAVTLTQPITNGLSYKFTFNFEKAGSTTIAVPLAAPEKK